MAGEAPDSWLECVNEPIDEAEIERLRISVKRGRPYGNVEWTRKMVQRLGLESTLRNPWRPKKKREPS